MPNKLTVTFKAMLEGELQRLGPDHFHTWAQENPTDFYRLAVTFVGKLDAGNPHVWFEVAGAGLRALAKAMDDPPNPKVGTPVLDPTRPHTD